MPGNNLFFKQCKILQTIAWVFHGEYNFSYTSKLSDGKFCTTSIEQLHSTLPRLWLLYVDDTFVIITRTEQNNFFEHINSINSHIKFHQVNTGEVPRQQTCIS